jgi:hypothetical protein
LQYIESALSSRQVYRTLNQIIDGLKVCEQELTTICSEMPQQSKIASDAATDFPALTLRRLAMCFGELHKLSARQLPKDMSSHHCQIIACPQWAVHLAAFQEVIDVLREIKHRFKSKELAELRERLEIHLGNLRK